MLKDGGLKMPGCSGTSKEVRMDRAWVPRGPKEVRTQGPEGTRQSQTSYAFPRCLDFTLPATERESRM